MEKIFKDLCAMDPDTLARVSVWARQIQKARELLVQLQNTPDYVGHPEVHGYWQHDGSQGVQLPGGEKWVGEPHVKFHAKENGGWKTMVYLSPGTWRELL